MTVARSTCRTVRKGQWEANIQPNTKGKELHSMKHCTRGEPSHHSKVNYKACTKREDLRKYTSHYKTGWMQHAH